MLISTGIDPARFEMEITESTACDDFEFALTVMNRLTELGVKLSLDDFGTGHSSLQYLQRMPVSTLKIDRTFISQIDVDQPGSLIIDAMIALGQLMGLSIVSEGVESREQIDYLSSRNCSVIQGYYYSKPVNAKEFERLLTEQPFSKDPTQIAPTNPLQMVN